MVIDCVKKKGLRIESMRKVSLLQRTVATSAFVLLAGWNAKSLSQPVDQNEWTPDASAISRVDTKALTINLPKEFGSLRDYSRYYFGTVRNDQRVIEGIFLSPIVERNAHRMASGRIHIIPESKAVGIADGGCLQVNAEFNIQTDKMETHCNFELPKAPAKKLN